MKDSMKETSSVEVKKGICCFRFAEIVIGLSMGVRVPMLEVLRTLQAAAKLGADPEMGFFVAVAVGHRIHDHGDSLEAAIEFAKWSGVPDVQVKARAASAADIIDDCDMNRKLAEAMSESTGALPPDVAAEIHVMAKVAGLPADFNDAQVIIGLHDMKAHGKTLDEIVQYAIGDSAFAKMIRERRLN